MDLAKKKIELIKWLTRIQDNKIIQQLENLRKVSANEAYRKLMPKTKMELQKKLKRSQADIKAGRVYTQDEVESYFKAKFERSKKAPSKIKKR